ncbi:DUF393 domain-containing protein [Brevibacterium sp. UMB10442]|nr:DUF393 domain-containing protein [Brevibacterium sp. UMB10442]
MPHDLVDLVFDGQCGFCTRAAYAIKRFDRKARIRLHPAQRPGVHERFSLTETDTQQAAWAFTHDRSASGAESINLVLDVTFGTRLFTQLYKIPGIRNLQDRAYTWVAEHRYLLRGTTPWCQSHPGDCHLGTGTASCSLR